MKTGRDELIRSLGPEPSKTLTAAVAGLRGAGPGLTPAGDDFIAGCLAGWTRQGHSSTRWLRAGYSLEEGPPLAGQHSKRPRRPGEDPLRRQDGREEYGSGVHLDPGRQIERRAMTPAAIAKSECETLPSCSPGCRNPWQ